MKVCWKFEMTQGKTGSLTCPWAGFLKEANDPNAARTPLATTCSSSSHGSLLC